jgi:hypothetical protein
MKAVEFSWNCSSAVCFPLISPIRQLVNPTIARRPFTSSGTWRIVHNASHQLVSAVQKLKEPNRMVAQTSKWSFGSARGR